MNKKINKRFTPEEKERVKEATDIVEVIGRYVALKKAGKLYKALSPFKNEKTPSFFVDPVKQRFDCYSSGLHGDVFEFLMQYPGTKWSFFETVEKLATEKGIHLTSMDKQTPMVFKDRLYEINEWACQWFQTQLWSDPEETALNVLRLRGFEDEFIRSRMIGYAPKGWNNLLLAARAHGYGKEELQYASLINFGKSKYYDTFRDRIMFPIRNTEGQVLSFGGRLVSDDTLLPDGSKPPKYLNGRINTIYKKNKVLYGLDIAKSKIRDLGEAWIVEGYLDVEGLIQAGITHSVALCGTNITNFHGNAIMKYAGKVMILLDGDNPGKDAIKKGVDNLLASGPDKGNEDQEEFTNLELSVCILPDGKDPQDFLKEHPLADQAGLFYAYVHEHKKPFLNVLVETFVPADATPNKRVKGIDTIAETLSLVKDPVLKKEYIKEIAKLTGQDYSDIFRQVNNKQKERFEDVKKIMEYKSTIKSVGAGEKELVRWVIANYGKTYQGHITFENKVITDLDRFNYEFHDKSLANIMACITALSANSQELTVENISKLNRHAAKEIEPLMGPLKWEEMKPVSIKKGYEEDMAFILNNYKKTMIKNRIEELSRISPRDDAQERILNRLREIQKGFE